VKILAEIEEKEDVGITGFGERVYYIECETCKEAVTIAPAREFTFSSTTPEQEAIMRKFVCKHMRSEGHQTVVGIAQFASMGSA